MQNTLLGTMRSNLIAQSFEIGLCLVLLYLSIIITTTTTAAAAATTTTTTNYNNTALHPNFGP
jgi:NADH:ubiquinone oxidoreductase subunit H